MAFGLKHVIDESNVAIQAAAAAYAKAVEEQNVVAAFDAAQRLSEVADAAVAVFVIVTGAVVGAVAESGEHTP
jgi:hypothetical protein